MAEDITKQQWDKKGKREVERNLTSQHLTGRLDNAKDKRIAFLVFSKRRQTAPQPLHRES
jgi:hypothetical protein